MKIICTVLIATIIIISGCKKEDSSSGPEDTINNLPVIITTEVTDITSITANTGGNVTNEGGTPVIKRGVCWGTTENPNLVSGNKTTNGYGTGKFTSNITGLTGGTKYYVRAYATNNVGTTYGSQFSFTTTGGVSGTFVYNGYTYHFVTIGTQQWTVENLRTTNYNDGTAISKVTDGTVWQNLSTDAYCAYNNDENNVTLYGYLYNWYVINTGKLAPSTGGWRVPTDKDWDKLIDYIGGWEAGTKLKAKSGWNFSGNGTDEYGFSGLPGGFRGSNDGTFHFNYNINYLWSSTADSWASAWDRSMQFDDIRVSRSSNDMRNGFSVRLVRDK